MKNQKHLFPFNLDPDRLLELQRGKPKPVKAISTHEDLQALEDEALRDRDRTVKDYFHYTAMEYQKAMAIASSGGTPQKKDIPDGKCAEQWEKYKPK